MAMWVHCMRYVPPAGIPAGELARRARLSAKNAEMIVRRMSKWWGYLAVSPDPADTRAKPPPSAWVVRPTRAGRQSQHVWAPLASVIEDRWQARFGTEQPAGGDRRGSDLPLSVLLSKVLLAFTIDFERRSDLALALSANVIRVLDDQGVRVRDLPALTGLADMGIDNSLSILEKQGYVAVGIDPARGGTKLAALTGKGRPAQDAYRRCVGEIEQDWESRFGEQAMGALRESLEGLVDGGTARDSPLFAGLEAYPDGWRSQVPRPDTLPHYPMVSHRGGFPDGS